MVLFPVENIVYWYEPYAIYAVNNQLTLNWLYFPRADFPLIEKDASENKSFIKETGNLDLSTIYITTDQSWVNEIEERYNQAITIEKKDNEFILYAH